jgi:elongation factor Ts
MVEINCQTDFAANSAEFRQFLPTITNHMNRRGVVKLDDPEILDLSDQIASVLREKVVVRRATELHASFLSPCGARLPHTVLRAYNHLGGKIAVLVGVESSVRHPAVTKLAEDLALQIAAMSPRFLAKEEVPQSEIEAQTQVFEEQIKEDLKPKPPAAWPKIIEGKLNKWYSEVCLLEQESILESKLTVRQLVERVRQETQAEIRVSDFRRYERGEKLGFIKHGE